MTIKDVEKMDRPKYIKNAIFWNRYAGENGAWLRAGDLNLITEAEDEYYTFASCGRDKFLIRSAYPYEDWMEKYIGTREDLRKDENFNYDY